MPKKIDPAVKERALRMFADHRADYPSDTALAEAVAKKVGVGRETGAALADPGRHQRRHPARGRPATSRPRSSGSRPRTSGCARTTRSCKSATVFFAGELDPRNR